MKSYIDLLWFGNDSGKPDWKHGQVFCLEATPAAVHEHIVRHTPGTGAKAWLFWDSSLGTPDPDVVEQTLNLPGDVWHAGLKRGTSGLPGIIDFIAPTWMLNHDPAASIDATSWRLSLRACLIRTEVLRQMGGVYPEFKSLDAAALELGHRFVTRGVLTRHIPQLASQAVSDAPVLDFEDELRFAYYRYGTFWSRWALGRAIITSYVTLSTARRAGSLVLKQPAPVQPPPFHRYNVAIDSPEHSPRVSVLVPTLGRQEYLRKLLAQLRDQTIKPFEIIVVDQTPIEERDTDLESDFSDLPLRVFYLEQPGQCSSRNLGLQESTGDYILFIDDDDEVWPDLIERHIKNLKRFRAQASCGVADEAGAGKLPEAFTYLRASDVFPTNNTLIEKDALRQSGLFDLAFDRGQRADHDLGTRLYLSGALMVLNPEISVFHHHAPAGGLRTHKARTVTYASSRKKLNVRHLPSLTEIYLALRYCTPRQVKEMLWLRAAGTFSLEGSKGRKLLKLIIGAFHLPDTMLQNQRRYQEASKMMKRFPQIHELGRLDIVEAEEPAPEKTAAAVFAV